jgi:lipopolysaccharide/colanic/teichoic acid biosynthesis glycosyltransferase
MMLSDRLTAKELLDRTGAAAALIVAAPVLSLAALLIRLCDGGPVLFRQQRLGVARRPFQLIKLRTMANGRVTRLGRVLRELGIDELPQLVNVLRGEMSLVGPRPLTVEDVNRLGWDCARFDARWSVRPGITGAAQVAPCRRCHQRTTWRLDRAYARAAGARADLRILAASLLVPLLGKARARRAARTLTWRSR